MDDLAPAPAQRAFDRTERTPGENFPGRRKQKMPLPPARPADRKTDLLPEPDPETEPARQLDLLA